MVVNCTVTKLQDVKAAGLAGRSLVRDPVMVRSVYGPVRTLNRLSVRSNV